MPPEPLASSTLPVPDLDLELQLQRDLEDRDGETEEDFGEIDLPPHNFHSIRLICKFGDGAFLFSYFLTGLTSLNIMYSIACVQRVASRRCHDYSRNRNVEEL